MPILYQGMAIKYIENSAFIHTIVIYIRSSYNYVISELSIIRIFVIAVDNHFWF